MTYTFKLSRRLARYRAAGLAALLLTAGACDSSDTFGPDLERPGGATPATATASFAGGIPFGIFAQPTSEFGARYNGAMRTIGPRQLLDELAAIKARGGKIVLMMAGSQPNYKDASGHFDLGKWKARIDLFKGVNFTAYVTDGTIIAHYLIDEPYDPANWGGQPVPGSTIDEMARYSKSIWPAMPTVVRAEPYLIKWSGTYRYLDAAWAQYLKRKGDVNDYLRRNVTEAQAMGLGLIVGLNVLHGGEPNLTTMSPSEVESLGSALLSSSYPCAFLSWTWDAGYLGSAGIGAAMDVLRAKAQNRASRSCVAGGDTAEPPSTPPSTPPTAPSPVAGALPFGVAFQPVVEYSSWLNGTVHQADPSTLVQRLEQAASVGMAMTVVLAAPAAVKNADGTFSITKWKAQVDRYRALGLGGFVSGKTLYLHNLVDQPRCAGCWGGKAITWEAIEEMARYSKAIWPGLPTAVRVPPSSLAKASFRWSALDAGWAQYSTPRGDVRTWLSAEATAAKNEGLGLVAGLNLLEGSGPGTGPMTATQIRDFGGVLAQHAAVCALVGWSWSSEYVGQAAIRDALTAVAATAKSRPAGACVVS
jgi:hypothetical protein